VTDVLGDEVVVTDPEVETVTVGVTVEDGDPLGDTVGVVETDEDPEYDPIGLNVALVVALALIDELGVGTSSSRLLLILLLRSLSPRCCSIDGGINFIDSLPLLVNLVVCEDNCR
jgi:hypothetical protein